MNSEEVQYKRDLIFGLVEDLGSLTEQVRYQETVPIANVPAELLNQWFEDFYHPDLDQFRMCFSTQELELLQEFNTFFEARLSVLPDTHDVHELHKSTAWLEVVEKAKETHAKLSQNHT